MADFEPGQRWAHSRQGPGRIDRIETIEMAGQTMEMVRFVPDAGLQLMLPKHVAAAQLRPLADRADAEAALEILASGAALREVNWRRRHAEWQALILGQDADGRPVQASATELADMVQQLAAKARGAELSFAERKFAFEGRARLAAELATGLGETVEAMAARIASLLD